MGKQLIPRLTIRFISAANNIVLHSHIDILRYTLNIDMQTPRIINPQFVPFETIIPTQFW